MGRPFYACGLTGAQVKKVAELAGVSTTTCARFADKHPAVLPRYRVTLGTAFALVVPERPDLTPADYVAATDEPTRRWRVRHALAAHPELRIADEPTPQTPPPAPIPAPAQIPLPDPPPPPEPERFVELDDDEDENAAAARRPVGRLAGRVSCAAWTLRRLTGREPEDADILAMLEWIAQRHAQRLDREQRDASAGHR